MENLLITGDIHGEPISRFSFRKNPALREHMSSSSWTVILGDVGLPFGINHPYHSQWEAEEQYNIKWLDNKPGKKLLLAGNHDDYDFLETLPIVDGNPALRKLANSLIYVIEPCALTINGFDILCIPGADSHDIDDGILDPEDPFYYDQVNYLLSQDKLFFRTLGHDWWPQEKINIRKATEVSTAFPHYDFIFSHDCPSIYLSTVDEDFPYTATEDEIYLDILRESLSFDYWIHGHFHETRTYCRDGNKILSCLYRHILCAKKDYAGVEIYDII